MSATYPASVRTFSPKQDATMFILAAHVNDLQDEVAAIENAVGPIPAEWDDTGGNLVKLYPTVKARLDDVQNTAALMQAQIASIVSELTAIGPLQSQVAALQTSTATINSQINAINNTTSQQSSTLSSYGSRITNLENNTGGVGGQLAAMQNQINALQQGAAAYIQNTGQVVAPDNYQWRTLNWNVAQYDNVGIFLGGSNLVCPQDGWWIVNLMGLMGNTGGGANGTECIANLEMRVDGNAVSATSEQLELGIGGSFRMNVPWAGPWYRGSTITAAINFNPYTGPNPSISALISFTRIHGL
jgi:prefoldin subunit 5